MPFAFPARTIKRMRVVVDADGRVEPYIPAVHADEGWWQAVLADPRAQDDRPRPWRPMAPALAGKRLHVTCDRCPVNVEADGDELLAASSRDVPVAYHAFALTNCRVRSKSCRFRYRMIPKG